jgi:hypothetical protein
MATGRVAPRCFLRSSLKRADAESENHGEGHSRLLDVNGRRWLI